MRRELAALKPPVRGITSLAVGADQLFARLVLEKAGRIYVVLPFTGIESSFPASGVELFRKLLASADRVEVLHVEGSAEDAYLAAGQRVVDLSDIVVAVWDGRPAKGKGGTADVVAYARRQSVPLIHLDPSRQGVFRS